jgi:hypothetical protein
MIILPLNIYLKKDVKYRNNTQPSINVNSLNEISLRYVFGITEIMNDTSYFIITDLFNDRGYLSIKILARIHFN